MVQFSKKVLATWAAVVVAEEMDLNLEAEKTVEVPVEESPDSVDLEDDDHVEDLGMNLGDDAEADMDMGGLGDLFGMMGGAVSDETKEIFAQHDANEDGKLDNEEFAEYLGEKMWEMSAGQRGGKEYLEVANVTGEEADGMKAMDKNGDGQITKEEYKAGMGGANEGGLVEMLDSNKSGGLEIEEFGFIVSMFGMGAGGHEDHDHAHDHDHSGCCGGHHHHGEEAHEHAHEEIEADVDAPSCSAKCNETSSCPSCPIGDVTVVSDDFYVEDEKAPAEEEWVWWHRRRQTPACSAECTSNETLCCPIGDQNVVSDDFYAKAEL